MKLAFALPFALVALAGCGERAVATSADGRVRIVATGWGTSPIPRRDTPDREPVWWFDVESASAVGRVRVEGSCGCTFGSELLGSGRRVVAEVPHARASDGLLRVDVDGTRLDVVNPHQVEEAAAAAPPPEQLPVSTRIGDDVWVLALDPAQPFTFEVRRSRDTRSGFPWRFRRATLRSATGQVTHLLSNGLELRVHRVALPRPGAPYWLCPHESWWSLTLELADGGEMAFRFVPPEEFLPAR